MNSKEGQIERSSYSGRFDIRQTNITKGVAVLFLLWHHLFYNSPEYYDVYTSLCYVNDIPIEAFISDLCQVCVAIFLILSGYGMSKSYSRRREKSAQKSIRFDVSFIKTSLLRLYVPFWVVFILFVP
ncbi:MAG: acyltransferase family protein, partial [Clostridiales bacterium]|nr:acyltransferase family protein [Clostridiales bacterium]